MKGNLYYTFEPRLDVQFIAFQIMYVERSRSSGLRRR